MSEPKPDAFHGEGGCYVIENGVRRRVEDATKDHPEGHRPRDADGKPLDVRPEPPAPAPEPTKPTPLRRVKTEE